MRWLQGRGGGQKRRAHGGLAVPNGPHERTDTPAVACTSRSIQGPSIGDGVPSSNAVSGRAPPRPSRRFSGRARGGCLVNHRIDVGRSVATRLLRRVHRSIRPPMSAASVGHCGDRVAMPKLTVTTRASESTPSMAARRRSASATRLPPPCSGAHDELFAAVARDHVGRPRLLASTRPTAFSASSPPDDRRRVELLE